MKNKAFTEQKFVELITASQGIIHKVCRMYCQDKEHRKDLFQEILIQLWKSYPSFRAEAKFSTWMYRVALNVAIQDLRKHKKNRQFFSLTAKFQEPPEEQQEEQQEEKLKQMYAAIAELKQVEKAIVMLYLEKHSNEDIAEIMGITQNNVRVKMSRIKVKLSKTISQY